MSVADMDKPGKTEARGDSRRFPSEMHRRQRGKNIALAAVLVGLMVLFYVVVIVRMSGA